MMRRWRRARRRKLRSRWRLRAYGYLFRGMSIPQFCFIAPIYVQSYRLIQQRRFEQSVHRCREDKFLASGAITHFSQPFSQAMYEECVMAANKDRS